MKIEHSCGWELTEATSCLNPYSNGMKIELNITALRTQYKGVLILIIME